MTETVTRLRGTTTEGRYGDDEWDWSDPDELEITGCSVAPRSEGEDNEGRRAVIAGYTVYAPADADVLPSDRLVIRTETHEVDGKPELWVSPYTDVQEGAEIRTRRVDG